MFILIIVVTLAMVDKVDSHWESYSSMEECIARARLILPELESKSKVHDFFVTCVEVK